MSTLAGKGPTSRHLHYVSEFTVSHQLAKYGSTKLTRYDGSPPESGTDPRKNQCPTRNCQNDPLSKVCRRDSVASSAALHAIVCPIIVFMDAHQFGVKDVLNPLTVGTEKLIWEWGY